MGLNTSDKKNKSQKTGVVYSFFRLCRIIIILVVLFILMIVAAFLLSHYLPTPTTFEQSRNTVTQERPIEKVGTKQTVTKNEEIPPQQKPIIADAPKEFYVRIAFFNDTEEKPITRERITRRPRRARPSIINPLSKNCRMWIRGFGDFYPTRDRMWEFGGALIEKAGPFDVNSTHMIYFYPDYSNERRVFKVPFKYLAGMNPEGSVRDMLTITVNDRTIVFWGTPITNVKGEREYTFSRKTFRRKRN